MFWRTFSLSRHGTGFMLIHHCDGNFLGWCCVFLLNFSFQFRLPLRSAFPFLFWTFWFVRFGSAKVRTFFVFPNFIFSFFWGRFFRLFLAPFELFVFFLAGCKGINLFAFYRIYFKLFSAYFYSNMSENKSASLFAGCKGMHHFWLCKRLHHK